MFLPWLKNLSNAAMEAAVLWIRDILVRIRIRIRIQGSVPLTDRIFLYSSVALKMQKEIYFKFFYLLFFYSTFTSES